MKSSTKPPTSPVRLNPELPDDLEKAIHGLLEKEPPAPLSARLRLEKRIAATEKRYRLRENSHQPRGACRYPR